MLYRPLGNSGIETSALVLGTWAIGGWMWGGSEEKDSIATIQAAGAAGINALDTAPIYGFGKSEKIVGKALRGHREEFILMTKCGLVWDSDQGSFFFNSEGKDVYRYLDPDSIRSELEKSLTRLQTDYIDLYQTHWQDKTTEISETMEELLRLKKEGKIRAIGVSNATPTIMEQYRQSGQIDSDQELFSLLDRKALASQLPYCQKRNISFLAYSSLGRGLLTGKIGPDRIWPKGDQRKKLPRFQPENISLIREMLAQLKPIATETGLTLGQLAVSWAITSPGCTHALVGARTPEQARDNAKIKTLDQEVMDRINAILESWKNRIR